MHERKFTEQIVEAIIQTLKEYPEQKASIVRVKVGEVYHLIPESVTMHFEMLTKDTLLEGVKLDLQEEPMIVECLQCRQKGPVEDHHLVVCPACYSKDVKVLGGNTITVESIEFDAQGPISVNKSSTIDGDQGHEHHPPH